MQHCKCTARILQFGSAGAYAEQFSIARAGHNKHTFLVSTAEIPWVWALPGYVALGNAGILWGCALQGYSAVGRCKNALRLLLVTTALAAVIGHCKDTWWLCTAGILCIWAVQGYVATGTAGIL